MFRHLTVRGQVGAVLWGYREVATVAAWTIAKTEGEWTLTASLRQADPYQCRQRPLRFTSPRKQGFWCWPVKTLRLGTHSLVATLGQPEQ